MRRIVYLMARAVPFNISKEVYGGPFVIMTTSLNFNRNDFDIPDVIYQETRETVRTTKKA